MVRISKRSNRKMDWSSCWELWLPGPRRIRFLMVTGTSMVARRRITILRSNASRTTSWPRCARLCCARSVLKPTGQESLRTVMAQLRPADLGWGTGDAVLDRFEVKVLTEGSGTQIFSTTFAQWTAREVLRRAQPLTLLVRFAPRQRQRPMNEMLSAANARPELDFTGSLVDADF